MRPCCMLKQRSVISILLIVTALIFVTLQFRPVAPDPNDIGKRAQTNLGQASSYRFHLLVRTMIDHQDQVVATITGEFIQPDTYHLKGTNYDYELDLYYVNGELIFLDPADKHWKRSPAAPSLVTEAVLFTTSPMADFLAAQEFRLITSKHVEGKRVYHLSNQLASIANPYWEIFFSDFELESFVTYPDYRVQKLHLRGTNSHREDKLLIELTLTDFNQAFEISVPDETEKTFSFSPHYLEGLRALIANIKQ